MFLQSLIIITIIHEYLPIRCENNNYVQRGRRMRVKVIIHNIFYLIII